MNERFAVHNRDDTPLSVVTHDYSWIPWLRGWWCTCGKRTCVHIAFVRRYVDKVGE